MPATTGARTCPAPSTRPTTTDDGDEEDPVAAALRVRANDVERPTLLQPAAAISPAVPVQPTSLMVATVLSSPVWSGGDLEYVAGPVAAPPPAPVVVATPQGPTAPPPLPPVITPPPVVTPPVEPEEPAPEEPPVEPPPGEEPGYGTEEPPVEEPIDPPVDPPSEPVEGTTTEQTTEETTATGSEPAPPGPLVETVG